MLQALVDYARREQLIATPGLKPKTIRWLLVFSPEGRFQGLHDYSDDRRNQGREFSACPDLTQQEMVAAGSGCRHFLVDSLAVVCLPTKDGDVDAKLVAKHEFFVDLLEQAAVGVPKLAPIAAALRDERTLESIRARLSGGKAKPTDLATPAVADESGQSIFVERDDWREWWHAFRNRLIEGRRAKASSGRRKKAGPDVDHATPMLCLISGELVEPQPTHNKIEGLSDVGGLSMGDTLASFDKDAFSSFGLRQGANAAMSETMVKTYVTAMNHLVRHRSHRMAGVKVIYWYSCPVERDEDPVRELLEGIALPASHPPDGAGDGPRSEAAGQVRQRFHAESHAQRLLDAIRAGERPELWNLRYYAMTLSANRGRVVIRDWMEGRFEELLEAVSAWFDDLAIVSRDGREIVAAHKFVAVLAASLRDLKDASLPLVAVLWRCALKRQPIPYQVMAQTLGRVRTGLTLGERPRHARFGLLKAFCNRNERISNMNADLNEYEVHPAYLAGRILAILARIQQAADAGTGAGGVQRCYGAASSTPSLVLGRLVRTAQIAHLPKIENKALQTWFQDQLAEVWARLDRPLPPALSLGEQTLFAMGYYQQNAKCSNSVKEDQPDEVPVAAT